MKKGQVLEGTIEKVEFPNKGVVTVAEEGKSVIVKNGIPGQKVKFCVNKFKRGRGAPVGSAGEISAGNKKTGVQHFPGMRRVYVPDHVL